MVTSAPVVEAMVASSCTVSFDEPKQVVRLGGGSTGKLIKNAFCALNEILRKKKKAKRYLVKERRYNFIFILCINNTSLKTSSRNLSKIKE